jgi:drug/metabolite transporter (DMT)-like permease
LNAVRTEQRPRGSLAHPRLVAKFVLVCAIGGSTWAVLRLGLEGLPPFAFAFERAVAVALIVGAGAVALGRRFPRQPRVIGMLGLAGVFNIGLSWIALYCALHQVPSSLAALVAASAPAWSALIGHFFIQGNRLTRRAACGLALSLAGLTVLLGSGGALLDGDQIIGAVAVLAVVPLSMAIAALIAKPALREVSPSVAAVLQMAFGALFLAPFALVEAGTHAWEVQNVAAFAYLVLIGSCAGFVLFLVVLREMNATSALLWHVVVPVEAVLIGVLVLGEPLSNWIVVGGALVFAGVWLVFTVRPSATPIAGSA